MEPKEEEGEVLNVPNIHGLDVEINVRKESGIKFGEVLGQDSGSSEEDMQDYVANFNKDAPKTARRKNPPKRAKKKKSKDNGKSKT